MKRTFATVVALGIAFAFAHPTSLTANAQGDDTYRLDRTEYRPGATIYLLYDLSTLSCTGPVTSEGFVRPIEFNPQDPALGTGTAIDTPGTYEAVATCKNGIVTRTFTIKEHEPTGFDLFALPEPTASAGRKIIVFKSKVSKCAGPVTSKGFVAPAEFTSRLIDGSWSGEATVIDTPGTYEASMTCEGKTVTRTFTIVASGDEKPAPQKAPIVKPKGAPQTGGGGTTR